MIYGLLLDYGKRMAGTAMIDEGRSTRTGDPLLIGAVDDHPALLSGLRSDLAEIDPALRLVAMARNVDELMDSTADLDIVLLDLRLGDGSRPRENVKKLLSIPVRVLIYTEGSHRSLMLEALAAGAVGILRKNEAVQEVARALRAVATGEIPDTAELAATLQSDPGLGPHLAPREREVLELYASGMAAKSVARRMDVKLDTAKEYLKRIRAKYAAMNRPSSTRMDLYRRAVEDGLIDPHDPDRS